MKTRKTVKLIAVILVMAFLIGCHNQPSSSATTTTKSVSIDSYDYFSLSEELTSTYYNSKQLDISLPEKKGSFEAVNGVIQDERAWILVEQITEGGYSYYLEDFNMKGEREDSFSVDISSYCSRTSNYMYADSEFVYLVLPSESEDALFDLYSISKSSHETGKAAFHSEQNVNDSLDEIIGVRNGDLYVSVSGSNGTACQVYDLKEKKCTLQTDYVEKVWPQGWFWNENKLCVVEDTGTSKESKILEFSSEGVAQTEVKTPGHLNGFTYQNNSQYMVNEQGIWKQNAEKKLWENFLLFSNSKSAKAADFLNDRFSISPDATHVLDWSRYSGEIQLLFVDQDPTKGKKELILAGRYLSLCDTLYTAVQRFNETSETYSIKLLDYNNLLDENDFLDSEGSVDYLAFCDAVEQKLLKDILAGNAPDMLYRPIDGEDKLNTAYLDIGGYFKDMYPYWMAESEAWRNQFVSCAFVRAEKKREMKAIPFSFRIKFFETDLSCKIDEHAGYGEWLEYMENQSEAPYLIEDTSEVFLRECLNIDIESFIDKENNQAHFERKEFGDLMRLAKKYCPTEREMEEHNFEYAAWDIWDYYGNSFWIDNYHTIYGLPGKEKNQGAPTADGAKYCVKYTDAISVTENCKDVDAAWEFIKEYIFSREAQESEIRKNYMMNTPVRIESLRTALDIFQNPEDHLDFWDDHGEFDGDGWDGDLHGYTDEEMQSYWDLLNTTTYTYYPDVEIVDVVVEEASAYFADQKSLEEVIDLINNRVQIILNERST